MSKDPTRRIIRDLKNLREDPELTFIVLQTDEEILQNKSLIVKFMTNNKDSPYYFENEMYSIKIQLYNKDKVYPYDAPKVQFMDKVFHPNISESGDICVDILKSGWSPLQNFRSIMISIMSLLDDPNPSSALNSSACGNLKDPNFINIIRKKTIIWKN